MARLSCNNGECHVESKIDLTGFEIDYNGIANIEPKLPDGWVLRGSNHKLIIININGTPIKSSLLFTYTGFIRLGNMIACDTNLNSVTCFADEHISDWRREGFKFDINSSNWDDMKDLRKSGTAKNTTIKIPIKGGLKTDGGLYYLGDREYKGLYHIHEDVDVAMTGRSYDKNSKILSKEPTKMKETARRSPSRRRSYSRGSRRGGY